MNKIKFANGNVIQHGQLRLNPREGGRPKNVGTPPIGHGMKNVGAKNHPLAFDGARRPLDDEPMEKSYNTGRTVPVHDGQATHMRTAHERGFAPHPRQASQHLLAASRLSARDAQKSKDEGFDHSFIGHKVGGQSLPASKRKLSE